MCIILVLYLPASESSRNDSYKHNVDKSKGVPTAVKRQPVGTVHAYRSDDSDHNDILMLTWINIRL